MIIMSVDYGDVRTGIAVCDKMQILASPVCVITEKDREKLADKIKLAGGTFVAPLIANTAHIAKGAKIGKGTVIMHNAVIIRCFILLHLRNDDLVS